MTLKRSSTAGRSSVLIIALWSVCLLTVFAVILGFEVRQMLVLVKRLDDRAVSRLIAEAGVRKAAAVLAEGAAQKYDTLNQRWSSDPEEFKDVMVGNGKFSVSYEDENGDTRFGMSDEESKININKAGSAVMSRLFKLCGLEDMEAQDLAFSIVDWRDSDSGLSGPGGAEDSYYHSLAPAYEAKNAPFAVLDELFLVKGVDENVFQKIRKYITIYGSGSVNINTAPRAVLIAIGYTENIADRITAFRNGKDSRPGTADDNYFISVSSLASRISGTNNLSQVEEALITNMNSEGLVCVNSSSFMVESRAYSPGGKFLNQVVCVLDRAGKIFYWNEL